MISSNSTDLLSKEHCQYDVKCEKAITHYCRGCGQMYCIDHHSEHHRELQERFKHVMNTRDLVKQEWESLSSELSTDAILDQINQIYEYSLKLDAVEKTAIIIQQQLQGLINGDKQELKKQSITMTNRVKFDQNDYFENEIERLKQDIEELRLKLEEIRDDNQKRLLEEQSHTVSSNVPSDDQSETTESPLLNNNSRGKNGPIRLTVHNSSSSKTEKLEEDGHVSVKTGNETHPEQEDEEEEMMVFLDSNTTLQINHKVRFSNNIVRWLRGPFKAIVHGVLGAVDLCAQQTHVSDSTLQAVKKRLAKQPTTDDSIKPTFVEITSDWKLEGENADQGYSSASLWIRDPQGQRVLIKIQELPLCAANEWLAYVLGRLLGLPVNEVQISIYENKLATLHVDAQNEDEQTITFMDLPKRKSKILLTNPIMESMDIFDHIIQNVDRNQQNILIILPKTVDINDDDDGDGMKAKLCLIDHASSFGMGRVSGVSTMAAKFHSNHLSVVKFDPIEKSKQFEQYLNKLPVEDRPLISKTLDRFASITNDQFDSWITEIQDLLSSSQYNRIYCVLRRQRDIAKRFMIEWNVSPRSSGIKSNEVLDDSAEDK